MQTVQPKIELLKESEGSGKVIGKVVGLVAANAMRPSTIFPVLFIFLPRDIVRG